MEVFLSDGSQSYSETMCSIIGVSLYVGYLEPRASVSAVVF